MRLRAQADVLKITNQKKSKRTKYEIYTFECEHCKIFYIGRTLRNFDIKINEHVQIFIDNKGNLYYANHFQDGKLNYDYNFDILHNENKGFKSLTVLAEICIQHYEKKIHQFPQ